jgi:hypothetical protein
MPPVVDVDCPDVLTVVEVVDFEAPFDDAEQAPRMIAPVTSDPSWRKIRGLFKVA